MPAAYDPEIAPYADPLRSGRALGPSGEPASDGWQGMRRGFDEALALQASMLPDLPHVRRTDHDVRRDGEPIGLRWYSADAPASERGTAAVVYLHGGAMIAGSVDLYDRVVAAYVAMSGVPFLAVDYRLAPQLTGDGLVLDAFAGLGWLVEHAGRLCVDPARIAVMGDSAGGGIAAGTAILARDRGVSLARQLLVYPMLDDRTTLPDPVLAAVAFFSYADNRTGWQALLGDAWGTDRVPDLAAPARAVDLVGLAPAYLEVGELDIFRDETVTYARRLLEAGVSAELHVYAGAPHGYDRIPGIHLADRAMARRDDVLRSL